MDSVFGIGSAELLLILILAGLIMGPHQIRRVARQMGYWSIRFRRIYHGFLAQINAELDSVDESGELRGAVQEMRTIGQDVGRLRQDVLREATQIGAEGQKIMDSAAESIRTIADEAAEQTDDLPPAPPPPTPVDVEGDVST